MLHLCDAVRSFPHLARAKVLAVTNGESMWQKQAGQLTCKSVGPAQMDILTAELHDAKRTMMQKQGIDAEPFTVFAQVSCGQLLTN